MLSCVERIVAAFAGAANTLAAVKERKEKKKRKKDKEVEELVEIRLLHKSLMEVRTLKLACDGSECLHFIFDRARINASCVAKTDIVDTVQHSTQEIISRPPS